MAGWLWLAGCRPGPGSGQGLVEPVEHPGAERALGADLGVGAGAFGVGEAGQGGGCGQVCHEFFGLAGEEVVDSPRPANIGQVIFSAIPPRRW